jgi:hypothetical protein
MRILMRPSGTGRDKRLSASLLAERFRYADPGRIRSRFGTMAEATSSGDQEDDTVGTTTLASRSWRSTLRRLTTVAVIPAAVVALSGCGANFDAQTNQIYQAAEGTNDRSALVYALNTLVVGDGEGNGTVVVRLVNNGPEEDELQSFTAQQDDGSEIKVAALTEPIGIGVGPDPDQSILLGPEGELRLHGGGFEPGDFIKLNLVFAESEPLSINTPVVPQTTPTPSPSRPMRPRCPARSRSTSTVSRSATTSLPRTSRCRPARRLPSTMSC